MKQNKIVILFSGEIILLYETLTNYLKLCANIDNDYILDIIYRKYESKTSKRWQGKRQENGSVVFATRHSSNRAKIPMQPIHTDTNQCEQCQPSQRRKPLLEWYGYILPTTARRSPSDTNLASDKSSGTREKNGRMLQRTQRHLCLDGFNTRPHWSLLLFFFSGQTLSFSWWRAHVFTLFSLSPSILVQHWCSTMLPRSHIQQKTKCRHAVQFYLTTRAEHFVLPPFSAILPKILILEIFNHFL